MSFHNRAQSSSTEMLLNNVTSFLKRFLYKKLYTLVRKILALKYDSKIITFNCATLNLKSNLFKSQPFEGRNLIKCPIVDNFIYVVPVWCLF